MFNWFRKKKKPISKKKPHLITRAEIFKMFVSYWPKINPQSIYLADGPYVYLTESEVKKIVLNSRVESYIYEADLFDCDDFSLLLHADVIRKRYEEFRAGNIVRDQLYPLAFGQIWYRDFLKGLHAINLCITRENGILFIEPQNDKIWKANRDIVVDFVRI